MATLPLPLQPGWDISSETPAKHCNQKQSMPRRWIDCTFNYLKQDVVDDVAVAGMDKTVGEVPPDLTSLAGVQDEVGTEGVRDFETLNVGKIDLMDDVDEDLNKTCRGSEDRRRLARVSHTEGQNLNMCHLDLDYVLNDSL